MTDGSKHTKELLYSYNIWVWPDAHGDLVGGADPDKVEVGQDPGQSEGQPPGDHDAQVGEGQHRQDGQADRDGLRYADYEL